MEPKSLIKFYASLTIRQQEVLQLVSEGLSNKEIARKLYIEPCVVAGHLTNIYELFNIFWEWDIENRPNRYVVIRFFANFFTEHPELDRSSKSHPQVLA